MLSDVQIVTNNPQIEYNVSYEDISVKLTNVGYGVSQILPLLVEILSNEKTWFAIQQPEVHLHPKAQSAFGKFIFESFNIKENRFLIETHSDYTIDKFRYNLNKDKSHSIESQVVFFEKHLTGTKFTCLPISKDGKYPEEIPQNFRDFFIDEELKMLEI